MPRLCIGTSGYEYDDWLGRFYPTELPPADRLRYYAGRFSTVELNTTLYGLPQQRTVQRWRDSVPDDFVFAVKLSRYGTHLKRLSDPQDWLARFQQAVSPLGPSLGPVLVQLPPRWHRAPDRLDSFLAAAPDDWRITVEVRDPDWLHRSVYDVLRRHGAALCIHDLLEDHPRVVTADFVYLRFHGPDPRHKYTGSYGPQALSGASRRIRRHLADGLDVYAYFNNDADTNAIGDALDLARYMGG